MIAFTALAHGARCGEAHAQTSASGAASTGGNGAAPGASPSTRIVEVRLAMSGVAAENLAEARVRRLLEIELEDDAILAPGAGGPLGDHVAYVWVDLPSTAAAVIEVRVGERAVARRELAIQGLAWDVVARFVAIAASEMIRTQMRPLRPRRTPPPKRPSAREVEEADRDAAAVALNGAGAVVFLPAAAGFVAGPSLTVGLRNRRTTLAVLGRWMGGSGDGGPMRWFEAGLGGDYRLWLRPAWRLALGASASLASVRMADAMSVDGLAGERDTWSGRAAAAIAAEWRISRTAWAGLGLEPGVILRPVSYATAAAEGTLRGAWLGATLSLQLER